MTLHSDAVLSDLRVNGQTVPGFAPTTTSYANVPVDYTHPPQITATAADNGSVLITPPPSLPGTATVTVTSEDGSATTTYTVALLPATFTGTQVGATVASTLSLSGASPSFWHLRGAREGAQSYLASTTASVTSTAATAALSVADPSATATGYLVNGAYLLAQPLQASASSPGGTSRAAGARRLSGQSARPRELERAGQQRSRDDPAQADDRRHLLRTGTYSKTVTFTLSTATP